MANKTKGAKRAKTGENETYSIKEILEQDKQNIRDTYGGKFFECLQRGLTELRQEEPKVDMTEEKLRTLSNQICDACYDFYWHDRRVFKQKIFEIYSNMKRENNHDLRRKIITKVMTVNELIHAETIKLAPDEVQQKRQIEVEKHYLRNVILPGDRNNVATTAVAEPTQSPESDTALEKAVSPSRSSSGLDRMVSPGSRDGTNLFDSDISDEQQSDSSGEEEESDQDGDGDENAPQSDADTARPGAASTSPAAGLSATRYEADGDRGETSTSIDERGETGDHTPKRRNSASPSSLMEDIDSSSIFLTRQHRVESDEEATPKRPQAPDGSQFTLEHVMAKIEGRLDALPAYIAKPFRGPLKCGHKRVSLLMARSHILHSKQPDHKISPSPE
ncbi:transcription factor s-ii (tfiis) central domain-containing protein [Babesia ovata]|uniref:Transcription factor s-ii (Tfiis) central domain-containing protein n=1 Tax=Babesia ovata TaxID=189622 RepID=A0A2H6KE71_9APIC|nr:transcription factor s-ii (tfiis) central domain-containing protein [Babesia ovata]GBE61292.1 transcription factor s-ii (tfiis) central domain-containing protein [Babesia ovata]